MGFEQLLENLNVGYAKVNSGSPLRQDVDLWRQVQPPQQHSLASTSFVRVHCPSGKPKNERFFLYTRHISNYII